MDQEGGGVRARKILTLTLNHYPRSAVEHLYLSRSAAGHKLSNIEHLFYRKLVANSHHLTISTFFFKIKYL